MKYDFYVVTIDRPSVDQSSIVGDYLTVKVVKGQPAVLIIHEAVERLGWKVRAIIPVLGFPKGGDRSILLERHSQAAKDTEAWRKAGV
jgi:hypothetical protein